METVGLVTHTLRDRAAEDDWLSRAIAGGAWPEDLDRDRWEHMPREAVPKWMEMNAIAGVRIVAQQVYSTDPAAELCSQRAWTWRHLVDRYGRRWRAWFAQPLPEGFSDKPLAATYDSSTPDPIETPKEAP